MLSSLIPGITAAQPGFTTTLEISTIRLDRADHIEYIKTSSHMKQVMYGFRIQSQFQEQARLGPAEKPTPTEVAPTPVPPTPEPTEVPVEPTPTTPSQGGWYNTGQASYYSSNFDYGGWENLYWLQASWGNEVAGASGPSPYGYHCVHADIDLVGVPIVLSANGVTITCITADTVQEAHKWQWRQSWVIELSWTAFVNLGLDANNYVEVYIP